MEKEWGEKIDEFLKLCCKQNVRMLMVGGGAVNFHGYQRHSADVDFWLDVSNENLSKLVKVLNQMGFEITDFPEEIYKKEQNISLKFTPISLYIELITNFKINKTFDEAYNDAESAEVAGFNLLRWRVLSFDDLIDSKIRASRPKDLLDIQELKRIKNLENE